MCIVQCCEGQYLTNVDEYGRDTTKAVAKTSSSLKVCECSKQDKIWRAQEDCLCYTFRNCNSQHQWRHHHQHTLVYGLLFFDWFSITTSSVVTSHTPSWVYKIKLWAMMFEIFIRTSSLTICWCIYLWLDFKMLLMWCMEPSMVAGWSWF